jgi:hypothetical protein
MICPHAAGTLARENAKHRIQEHRRFLIVVIVVSGDNEMAVKAVITQMKYTDRKGLRQAQAEESVKHHTEAEELVKHHTEAEESVKHHTEP